ncbi:MerR family transcriptional regulator [Streptomyces palmae]|uniref:MerR family transcriptional regulator n=1 Tax=Streptomyces palmae TaxID=1701085 RepID=A0A4Z0H673_9ACTN|nr:MerR family transcriptional regulator [Streptomyces palmae]TGB07862.1 MerR family transcriptional regulator [Streptomyces palmae]
MNGGPLYSIGDLARRTGLTVKTIRYYSDSGLVPPTDRSPAGYRRYDADAAARLDLVRTLRELGLELAAIRQALDRKLTLQEIAGAHAEALEVRIRTLRLRRAVLATVARRGADPQELDLMHRLATLSATERQHLVADFLDAAFGGPAGDDPGVSAVRRSMTPELPEDPTAEQIEAWVELAELCQDADFRAGLRRAFEQYAADRARAGATGVVRDPFATVREQIGPALAAGIDPASPQADPIVAAVTAHYARTEGRPDDGELRRGLLERMEAANDPRRERYLRLLAVINGWPAPASPAPALDWCARALRARTAA